MRRLPFFILLFASACATVQPSRALVSVEDHAKFSLTPNVIAPWEDGMRTDGTSGTYEWWYFDAHLDDGSTLVIVFFTKPIDGANGPLRPMLRVDLDRPDGTKFTQLIEVDAKDFTASKERCDVTLGKNRVEGDLHSYSLHLALPDFTADLTLKSAVQPWRPAAGVLSFGAKDEKYFAWLPSVPHGALEGTLVVKGLQVVVKGTGYHDHNWGNASLAGLIHDWYWGRAQVGGYSIITSFITAEDAYSANRFPLLLVAKGNDVLVGDSTHVRFESSDVHVDEVTGKPVASSLRWIFEDAGQRVRVSFSKKKDLARVALTDQLPGFTRFLAKLAGFDGAYHRFTGDVSVERFEGDTLIEQVNESAAVWELMYLGHATKP